MYKGEFTFQIAGVTQGFKFGTLAEALFCEREGITPKQLKQRISEDDPMIDIDYAYYAACAYCRLKGINVEFTKDEVSCWIDEIGKVRFTEMIVESFKTYVPKNDLPPKEGELQTTGDGKTSQPSA